MEIICEIKIILDRVGDNVIYKKWVSKFEYRVIEKMK